MTKRATTDSKKSARLVVAALVVVACPALDACFLAPPPVDGEPEGSACTTDLDCGSGLICACGTCAEATEPRDPPSCDVVIDDRCPSTPSVCYEVCGVEVVVGIAACVNGRETCFENGGVLRDDCPAGTCWGEPEPGEICVDGVFECQYGRNGPTGLCYTFDCSDEPEECVTDCSSDVRTLQACLGSVWKCEFGFPVRQCGGCVGTPPPCVESCDAPYRTGSATCIADAWSCAGSDGELESVCCGHAPGATVSTSAQIDALANETCLIGELTVATAFDIDALTWPLLRRVGGLSVSSTSIAAIRMPALVVVDEDLSIVTNPVLVDLELDSLAFIGGDLTIDDAPLLDVCVVETLVEQVLSRDGVDGTITVPTGDGGCVDPDAGLDDAGLDDAGLDDAGLDDAGLDDAGLDDAGLDDAGVDDAGVNDAGLVDAGAADGG